MSASLLSSLFKYESVHNSGCLILDKVLNRSIRVDHKHNYQVPKERGDEDDLTKTLRQHGCAPPVAGAGGKESDVDLLEDDPETG